MTFKAHTVPGLSKPVYMPDDIPVHIDLVPARQSNIRSNSRRSASSVTKYTQHETANFNVGANARMHRNYLHNGAGGSYVGFNSVNDDRELFVLTPYDEDTWAAGTPDGNHTSDHAELCVNEGINHKRAREIAARWAAGVIHARGLTVAKALVQHNIWFGKNCPLLLRRDGLWPWFVQLVQQYYDEIVVFLGGKAEPATAQYAAPDPVPGIVALAEYLAPYPGQTMTVMNRTVRAIRDTPRFRNWEWAKIGPDIKKGEEFKVIAEQAGLYTTPYYTRVRVEDTEIVT